MNLITPVDDALHIIGRNINQLSVDTKEVTLTEPMAVWSYSVVFHSVVHRTTRVYYDDGRRKVLIADHGG